LAGIRLVTGPGPVSEKKSTAGRKPIDVMVMFRMLVLQSTRQILWCMEG
jgi:hypothetical protein